MRLVEAYNQAQQILKDSNIDEYGNDAMLLLLHVFDLTKSSYYLNQEKEISAELQREYFELINIRSQRTPLQYITNEQTFYGYSFYVDENVLIPRFDTEVFVENVIKASKEILKRKFDDVFRFADICTGSGCILLSVLLQLKNADGIMEFTGVDISEGALGVADKNAKRFGVSTNFLKRDILTEQYLDGEYDVIVSNPPYIEKAVIPTLMEEVKDHEPMIALDGGDDGLIFYRKIIMDAFSHLKDDGVLAFEIGYDQGEAVSELMKNAGYKRVSVIEDYAHNPRVCMGYK